MGSEGKTWTWGDNTFMRKLDQEKRIVMQGLLLSCHMHGEPVPVSRLFEMYDEKVQEMETATDTQYVRIKNRKLFLEIIQELRDLDMRFDIVHPSLTRHEITRATLGRCTLIPIRDRKPYILGNGGSDEYA